MNFLRAELLKKNNGMFTLEASVIMPVIIMTLVFTLWLVPAIYQRYILKVAVDMSAASGSHTSGSYDIAYDKMPADSFAEEPGLYRRFSAAEDNRIQSMASMKTKEYLGPNASADYKLSNFLIFKLLTVTISKSINAPGWILDINEKSSGVVHDTTEFIRTVDIIMELVKTDSNSILSLKDSLKAEEK